MGPPSYMRSVIDRNVVMRRIPVHILGWHPFTCRTWKQNMKHEFIQAVSLFRKVYNLQILRLSQQCSWVIHFSGMWRWVTGSLLPDVSRQCGALK